MSQETPAQLAALAGRLAGARAGRLEDLYLSRVSEAWFHLERGVVKRRTTLLREGAAARTRDDLRSSDGLDRIVLGSLLDLPARTLPPLRHEPLPEPPDAAQLAERLGDLTGIAHWRASWAAVVRRDAAVLPRRPELFEVVVADRQRGLATWPPPPDWLPPRSAAPGAGHVRPGPASVVLAPAAAAVLLHELLGHPLEGDLLLRGASPWAGKLGRRIFDLDLDLDDDPTLDCLPGSFTRDDEGSPAVRRPLLRAGVLVGALADRTCAAALGVPPGNARRSTVHTPPTPRMSNLVARAAANAAELPREAARLEVTSLRAGRLEPHLGVITLLVRSAFALHRGERTRPLAPFTLAASVDALRNGLVAAGGPALPSAEPGWCSKDGAVVATGAIAPSLLLAGLEVV
jgi:PmbA/TldA metallopeptidase C-terminal domain